MICALGAYWYCSGLSMHRDHDIFVKAIRDRTKIRLIYYDGPFCRSFHAKSVVPMDYNPGRHITDESNSYHFWDFDFEEGTEEGTNSAHLVLKPNQIESMRLDKETFEPAELRKRLPLEDRKQWRRWFLKRDWGPKFS